MNKKTRLILIASESIALVAALIVMFVLIGKIKDKPAGIPLIQTGTDIGNGTEENTSTNTPANTQAESTQAENTPTENETTVNSENRPVYDSGNHTVTGNDEGNGYEGVSGTGKYNYGEALQKSLIFYELQRSGKLPDEIRTNWRGDSGLKDGSDVNLDLTGGWYDAGDNVKFNLPMAYTSSMLAWSVYEDKDAYEESGQLKYALSNIKWVNDYFIKCHPEDEVYYYQVGDGNADHGFWGPAEVVELKMNRPSYCVTSSAPGSAVTGQAAASLALCSIVFKDVDKEYSELCLKHAKSLFDFSYKYKSDEGYTAANGFYNSWSGFYDELSFSAAWLYIATGDKNYLTKSEECYSKANQDFDWAMCWDDVHIGAAVMLARITEKNTYKDAVEKHLDFWTVGTSDGKKITYTPKGLAWLDSWGALRYATTTGFIASVYSEWQGCSDKKAGIYWDFAVSQANYALGDTGFSYMIGFGEDYPQNPHHRTSQGSYCDNMNEPAESRHTLFGALVGGPDSSDGYSDKVSDYTMNEVACDYNAGFTGLLAKLYKKYHGRTLVDFGAVEEVTDKEFYSEAGINAQGNDFIEIKAFVYNKTGWPARNSEDVELRYFIDLSEVFQAGGSEKDIEVSTNYMKDATAEGIKCFNEEKHIYYLSIKFDGTKLFPGGQDNYKKEVQVRMKNSKGVWDNGNDPSFAGLQTGSVIDGAGLGLYENGKLVYGKEPS